MSAEERLPLGPSNFMEALDSLTWEGTVDDGEEQEEEEDGGMGDSSPNKGSTDESEDDSDPEPPPPVRRKVSFADAFGLDLVSVKEFDNGNLSKGAEEVAPAVGSEAREAEEYSLSCLFSVPASAEALGQRLREQKLELESIELLPGTSVLRGIVRVVNLSFSKSVYVRISLDGWKSHFDLLAGYIPGSSDGETDGFSFKLTLAPPFDREGGARVEFCLRYETAAGSFWANNGDMNYVLFCHQKSKQPWEGEQEESSPRSKRSCLKANRKSSAEEKPVEIPSPCHAPDAADSATRRADTQRRTLDNAAETPGEHQHQKPLVCSQRSRQRVERLARMQNYFSQRQQEVNQKLNSLTDSAAGKPRQPAADIIIPPLGDDSSGPICTPRRKPTREAAPPVATYHQIPLLTLDWSRDRGQGSGCPEVNHIWNRAVPLVSSYTSEEKMKDKMSVCDLWKAFLNDPKDNSCVPESEWLQSAASVCPSNDREETQSLGVERQRGVEVFTQGEPVKSRYIASRGDNGAYHDPDQKSEGRSVTNTLREATSVLTRRSADTRHKQGEGEQGGDHVAEEVSGSGELGTTGTGEWVNAEAAVDRTSAGATRDETFSPAAEGGVMGKEHKAADDTVTFTETTGDAVQSGGRCVLVPHSYGEEGGFIQRHNLDEEGTSGQNLREEGTSGQNLREEVASGQNLREEVMSGHNLREEVTSGHNLREEGTSGHNLREEGTSGHNLREEVTSGHNLREEVTSGQNQREEGMSGHNLREEGTSEHNLREEGTSGHNLREEGRRGKETAEAGERRDVRVGEREEEEEGCLENRKGEEVRELVKESESTPAERGEVSAGVEDERVGNEKLSEGTKEAIAEDDRLSLEPRGETGEEEGLTGREDLGEGMLAEVLDSQEANEERCDERGEGRAEERGASLSRGSQVSHDFKRDEAESVSDEVLSEADSRPGPDPLVVLHTDLASTFNLQQSFNQTTEPVSSAAEPCRGEDKGQSLPPSHPPLTLTPPAREHEGREQAVRIRHSSARNTTPPVEEQESFGHVSFPPPPPPSSSPPSERAEAARSALTWWGVVFSHGLKALACALLVAAFLVTMLLYDFPACFALYLTVFWWCSQSEKQRGPQGPGG